MSLFKGIIIIYFAEVQVEQVGAAWQKDDKTDRQTKDLIYSCRRHHDY